MYEDDEEEGEDMDASSQGSSDVDPQNINNPIHDILV